MKLENYFTEVTSKDVMKLENYPGHVIIVRLVRYSTWDSTMCL